MNTPGIVNSALKAAGIKSAAAPAVDTAALSAALAPLISLLPKVFPLVARNVRRHPVQAAVTGVGLVLIAGLRRRHASRRRYSRYFN